MIKPRSMTDDEIEAAALSDPENRPLSEERLAKFRRVPIVKRVRRKLALTQEAFAERFRIPIGTVRDWEQGRAEPDAAALAYLTLIEREPNVVEAVLSREAPA